MSDGMRESAIGWGSVSHHTLRLGDPDAVHIRQRMVLRSELTTTEDDERAVAVTCSTEILGRDKIILISRGIDLANYRANPIWLWQHNADWPVARSERIDVEGDKLVARVQFPPAGVSARADEVLGLIRAGVINAASTGFEKAQAEPIDPANPRAGTRIVSCELAEMSFVSIPAVPDALVTERDAEPETVQETPPACSKDSLTRHRRMAALFARELATG